MPTQEPVVVAPGLLETARRVALEALRRGSLQPLSTELIEVTVDGVELQVHVLDDLKAKDDQEESDREEAVNPFLPCDPTLLVAPLGEGHLCVLNKFNVLADHLLMITRDFVRQESLLDRSDFAALAEVMSQVDGLGFYNAGRLAGASQPHRHLQLVPWTSWSRRLAVIDRVEAGLAGAMGRVEGWNFDHGLESLADGVFADPSEAAGQMLDGYQRLLAGLGISGPSEPYNLLVARGWMVIVPRTAEACESVEINSLGFAGSLFARGTSELEVIRRRGWTSMLSTVTRTS